MDALPIVMTHFPGSTKVISRVYYDGPKVQLTVLHIKLHNQFPRIHSEMSCLLRQFPGFAVTFSSYTASFLDFTVKFLAFSDNVSPLQ